jgi:hypothetical protein
MKNPYSIIGRKNKQKGFLLLMFSFLWSEAALANPVIDHVAHGNVEVQQSDHLTTVQQSSSQAIIDWHSSNIGTNETTHFQQPQGGVSH